MIHLEKGLKMKPMTKKRYRVLPGFLAFLITVQTPLAAAAPGGRFTNDVLDVKGPQQTAEYIFRNSPRDNLITIQVFGSVARPGMYYVPEDTDLMKLLTLAGGVVNSSELDEVVVRKLEGKAWRNVNNRYVRQKNDQTYVVDVDSMLTNSPSIKPLRMSHDDFVYVPMKEPVISNDFYKLVTVASVLLTSVATIYLIRERSK